MRCLGGARRSLSESLEVVSMDVEQKADLLFAVNELYGINMRLGELAEHTTLR